MTFTKLKGKDFCPPPTQKRHVFGRKRDFRPLETHTAQGIPEVEGRFKTAPLETVDTQGFQSFVKGTKQKEKEV